MDPVTVLDVPTKSRRTTPPRSIQMEDDDWQALGVVAAGLGMSRAALLRDLGLWMIRKPGVTLPRRPAAEPDSATEDE